ETLPAAICCVQQHVIHLENMYDTEFLIAKRLGQCPLAAKVLGSRLCRKKDIAEWKAALKIGDLSDPFTSLLGASCIAACFQKRLGWITSMIWSLDHSSKGTLGAGPSNIASDKGKGVAVDMDDYPVGHATKGCTAKLNLDKSFTEGTQHVAPSCFLPSEKILSNLRHIAFKFSDCSSDLQNTEAIAKEEKEFYEEKELEKFIKEKVGKNLAL
ncbi:hypothetical protein ACJX0J_039134, partial [Zea mays]